MSATHPLQVQIFTPQKTILKDRLSSRLGAPGVEGFFEILPGHAPFATQLDSGVIKIQTDTSLLNFKTSGGFLKVQDDSVTLLLDDVEEVI